MTNKLKFTDNTSEQLTESMLKNRGVQCQTSLRGEHGSEHNVSVLSSSLKNTQTFTFVT